MERATTFLLVLLFSPECKVAFASALTKHYRDAVLFPETLPWPGVRRVRQHGGARAGTEVEEEEEGRAMGPSVRTALESRSERGPERSGSRTDDTAEHDSEFPSDAFETSAASSRDDDDGDSDGSNAGIRDDARDATRTRLTFASPYAARRALVSPMYGSGDGATVRFGAHRRARGGAGGSPRRARRHARRHARYERPRRSLASGPSAWGGQSRRRGCSRATLREAVQRSSHVPRAQTLRAQVVRRSRRDEPTPEPRRRRFEPLARNHLASVHEDAGVRADDAGDEPARAKDG